MQENNQQLEEELNELTINLLDLSIQQRELRTRSQRIEQRINRIRTEQRRRSRTGETGTLVRRDRHGDQIDIGDYVNFLTTGRHNSRGGTITQISHHRFVSARDARSRIVNREPNNVEVVRKFNEHHDRRRRL